MTVVIVEILIGIIVIAAGVWWEYDHCYPTLRSVRRAVMDDGLITHQWTSSETGISVRGSGKIFSYGYERECEGTVVIMRLYISLKGNRLIRPRAILTATFCDERPEKWTLGDGREKSSPSYEDDFVLRDILRIVENAPRDERR